MKRFWSDGSGSAVKWFALTAGILSVASMAGARTLAWLSEPGRIALVAYRAPPAPVKIRAADADIDLTPTGSIPSNAVVIRIR